MGLTGGTRAMASTAGAAVVGGLSVVFYGTFRPNLTHTLGGTCVTLTAITALALILIRHWVVDTSEERRALIAAQRAAQAEQCRYVALQAALESEQGRLTRDLAADRAGLAARLKAEREAMVVEFEEQRSSVIAETMEATVRMIRNKELAPPTPVQSKVIQLREHQEQRQLERERAREHGVVGP